jgi:hypothetical protein
VFELITSPNSATHTLLPDIFTFSHAEPQTGFFRVKNSLISCFTPRAPEARGNTTVYQQREEEIE